jgi:hypothetical protein
MSTCRNNTAIPGCFVPNATATPPIGITIHYIYDKDGVGFATQYTTPDGTEIDVASYLGGGTVLSGSCPAVNVDVEHELLCDDTDNNPATPNVSFVRRYERRFNAGTGVFIAQTVTDLELDLVTPYSIVGTELPGSACAAQLDVEQETFCDATGAVVIRRFVFTNGVQTTVGWVDIDGATVTPTLPYGPCPNCPPEARLGVITSWSALR